MSQVENATLSKVSTAPVPAPAYIADPSTVATLFENNGTEWAPTTTHGAQGEQWESVLVEVHDVTVTNEDLGHAQWEVTGGLVIDKKLFYYPGERSTGTKFKRITGILVYTFDAFKLAPRDADDLELDDGTANDDDTVEPDDGTTADADTAGPDGDTTAGGVISDIRQGDVTVDTTVEFEAVVTAVENVLDTEYVPTGIKGLFVSQTGISTALPWSGIYIFIQTPAAVGAYAQGDLLSVSGTYKEYYEMSQVENATLGKTGTATVPAAAVIADPSTVATLFENNGTEWVPTTTHGAQGEQWESVLIEVHDVTVTNEDLGHGMWEVTGGLVVDKKLFYYPDERSTGTQFSTIRGILVYTFDAFKLAPRDAADVVLQ
jgi:predicted extracellular nuclease